MAPSSRAPLETTHRTPTQDTSPMAWGTTLAWQDAKESRGGRPKYPRGSCNDPRKGGEEIEFAIRKSALGYEKRGKKELTTWPHRAAMEWLSHAQEKLMKAAMVSGHSWGSHYLPGPHIGESCIVWVGHREKWATGSCLRWDRWEITTQSRPSPFSFIFSIIFLFYFNLFIQIWIWICVLNSNILQHYKNIQYVFT
jgi:hypothetical protein